MISWVSISYKYFNTFVEIPPGKPFYNNDERFLFLNRFWKIYKFLRHDWAYKGEFHKCIYTETNLDHYYIRALHFSGMIFWDRYQQTMLVATCKMGETNTPTRDQSLKQRKGEQIKKRTKQLVEYLLYPN